MKVILEGCDGTGKTTLAKLLAERYGLDICHCTQHDPADYNFYLHTMRKENIVWDRHTLGELIYPNVFGRTPKLCVAEARELMIIAQQLGVKIFILTADIEVIKSRLINRGSEDDRILNKIEEIDSEFRRLGEQFHIPVIDTSSMTLNDIYKLMEEC